MEKHYEMVIKRRFERLYNMIQCKLYMKNEDIPENKDVLVYGFKHIKTNKINSFKLMEC